MTEEREPVPVRVIRKVEAEEEIPKPLKELPDHYEPNPIPRRWKV